MNWAGSNPTDWIFHYRIDSVVPNRIVRERRGAHLRNDPPAKPVDPFVPISFVVRGIAFFYNDSSPPPPRVVQFYLINLKKTSSASLDAQGVSQSRLDRDKVHLTVRDSRKCPTTFRIREVKNGKSLLRTYISPGRARVAVRYTFIISPGVPLTPSRLKHMCIDIFQETAGNLAAVPDFSQGRNLISRANVMRRAPIVSQGLAARPEIPPENQPTEIVSREYIPLV